MSFEVKIHDVQILILRELLFRPSAGYAELQKPTGLTSDHFNFHIGRLVHLGYVEKVGIGKYKLTLSGKEYANKLDTDVNTIERQPKIAVMLGLFREHNGQKQLLVQQRLKNPNFGFWGLPTGKVRWGETIIQTAERECIEETGLKANFRVCGIYHEHILMKESEELIEDKVFFICLAQNIKGELVREFEGGRNHWLTVEELAKKEKKFDSLESELKILNSEEWLIEKKLYYSEESF
jgi:8-oxo-dGTP pyrophosphatase MutT (NUDIX family)